ncbi:MAG: hypothetical protein WA688_01990 [Thermoplasmata archaeon]
MPTGLETAIGFEAILVVWIGVRSYGSYQGRRYSSSRVVVFPALILLLYLVTEFETIAAVPWAFPVWTAIDLAVLVGSALATLPFADQLVHVFRSPDGEWYYQYGIELIGIYLALWVVRFGLAAYYDPSSIEFVVPTGAALSTTASDALVLIQGLFSISSGLVFGRAIGTYRLHRRATERVGPAQGPLP